VVDKGPDAEIFLTLRKWDQRTEQSLADIDSEYAVLVDRYSATTGNLNPKDNQSLTHFYASWFARWKFGQEANSPIILHGIAPDNITKEVQEQAEKLGVVTSQNVGGKCAVPSRFIFGDQLLLWVPHCERKLSDTQWRCCETNEADTLLVPDFSQVPYVPFAPDRFFIGFPTSESHGFSPPTVTKLNEFVIRDHKKYYFGNPP
jgi:hypothetical protein